MRFFWSLAYGGVHPRRRRARRRDDSERPLIDWHRPAVLASVIAVLLLCTGDALLTLRLLTAGAVESNPLMAIVVQSSGVGFAIAKLAITGIGILVLVAIGRFQVFRVLRVESLVHAIVAAYLALFIYELSLLPLHS